MKAAKQREPCDLLPPVTFSSISILILKITIIFVGANVAVDRNNINKNPELHEQTIIDISPGGALEPIECSFLLLPLLLYQALVLLEDLNLISSWLLNILVIDIEDNCHKRQWRRRRQPRRSRRRHRLIEFAPARQTWIKPPRTTTTTTATTPDNLKTDRGHKCGRIVVSSRQEIINLLLKLPVIQRES